MSKLSILMRHLEAHIQEEIGAQGRTLSLLEAQQEAVATSDPATIARATRAVEDELKDAGLRARRRDELVKGFARLFAVDAGALTLSSIIERVGPDADRLKRQRDELRTATGRVARRARVVGTAARAHQRLTADIIETVLEEAPGAPGERGGALVDAEA